MNWGNSGILFLGKYELQIIESHDSLIYADGIAGAIYGQTPPLVNASRKPGDWQTYDIVFTAPRFEGKKLLQPAYFTVFWNGVLVQYHKASLGPMKHRTVGHLRFVRVNRPAVAAIPQFGRSLSQCLDPPLEAGRVSGPVDAYRTPFPPHGRSRGFGGALTPRRGRGTLAQQGLKGIAARGDGEHGRPAVHSEEADALGLCGRLSALADARGIGGRHANGGRRAGGNGHIERKSIAVALPLRCGSRRTSNDDWPWPRRDCRRRPA